MSLDFLLLPQTWISLLTLTLLELVLGIDNLVFLAIVSSQLPAHQQKKARQLGLLLAFVMRILLLSLASWMITLTQPLFVWFEQAFSMRDIFLILGGIFLLWKGTQEIHSTFVPKSVDFKPRIRMRFSTAIMQIMFLDIIFSFDSVITAVGMTSIFAIMVVAVLLGMLGMLLASEVLSRLIEQYPSIKMLALSFLILVGMVLVADGFGFHVPRGYIYFAMGFSIFVEFLNVMLSRASRDK